MLSYIFFAASLFYTITFQPDSEKNLNKAREYFVIAGENPCKAETYLSDLKKLADPELTIYIGGLYSISADCKRMPTAKYAAFNKGREIIDKSGMNRQSPDFRYVRYMIQSNAPAFLGYNKSIEEDQIYLKKFIEAGSAQDTYLKQIVKKTLVRDGILTQNQ